MLEPIYGVIIPVKSLFDVWELQEQKKRQKQEWSSPKYIFRAGSDDPEPVTYAWDGASHDALFHLPLSVFFTHHVFIHHSAFNYYLSLM